MCAEISNTLAFSLTPPSEKRPPHPGNGPINYEAKNNRLENLIDPTKLLKVTANYFTNTTFAVFHCLTKASDRKYGSSTSGP